MEELRSMDGVYAHSAIGGLAASITGGSDHKYSHTDLNLKETITGNLSRYADKTIINLIG